MRNVAHLIHLKALLFYQLVRNIFLNSKKKALEREFELLNSFDIPIFIINFNRLSYLEKLVEKLKSDGYSNINIIDNNSSYPPLLDYYQKTDCRVFRIEKNMGHMVFWKDNRFKPYRQSFYVVTDPDVMPVEECPRDYVKKFIDILCKYPFVSKVGFSLKLDDLPDDACLTKEVLAFEKEYYICPIKRRNLYYAGIDTTFAVYPPEKFANRENFYRAFRMGYPYQARHLPWYKKKDDITEEDKYYSENKTNGWWDFVKGEVTPDEKTVTSFQ